MLEVPEIPPEVVRLRQEIADGYGKPKVRAYISIEPEYLELGAFVIKRVAALYAAALGIEMPELPTGVLGYSDIEALVEEAVNKVINKELHIILAKTRHKMLELAVVNNGHLVVAAYGAEYDMWHTAYIAGHETAVAYAAAVVKPGTSIKTAFSLKGYAQLATAVGHRISSDALKGDGAEFNYGVTAKAEVEIGNIDSIVDVNFGTPLWDRYFDRFDF